MTIVSLPFHAAEPKLLSHDGMPFPSNHTVRDIQEVVNKGRRSQGHR